jgi:hypothetical protein
MKKKDKGVENDPSLKMILDVGLALFVETMKWLRSWGGECNITAESNVGRFGYFGRKQK